MTKKICDRCGAEINPGSWEELAIRIADVLDNVPEARGEE